MEFINSSKISNEDFIKNALKKETIKTLPKATGIGYLETKNKLISAITLQMAINSYKNPEVKSSNQMILRFNQAIAFAPFDTDLEFRAYVNRSAFLMNINMYEEALKDVKRALSSRYLRQLKPELLLRRANILFALNKFEEIEKMLERAEKSMHELEEDKKMKIEIGIKKLRLEWKKYSILTNEKFIPNPKDVLPHLFGQQTVQRDNIIFLLGKRNEYPNFKRTSEKLMLKYSKECGYRFETSDTIQAGEPLMINCQYANVIEFDHRYLRCWNCTNFCWSCVPCLSCANIIYCSESCRNCAHTNFHKIECPVLRVLLRHRNFYDHYSLMGLRILISALNEYKDFKDLQHHVNMLDDAIASEDYEYLNIIDTEYQKVYCMPRHDMKKDNIIDWKDKYSITSVYYMYILFATTELFGKKIQNSQELINHPLALFVGKLLFHHTMLSRTNMIPLKELAITKHVQIYGGAIVPGVNLFIPKSDVNSYSFFCRDCIVFTAMQRIQKGRYIGWSHGPNFFKMIFNENDQIGSKLKQTLKEKINQFVNSSSKVPLCLNHFENNASSYDVRLLFNELTVSKLEKWCLDRLEKVPCERIITVVNRLFQLIDKHDELGTSSKGVSTSCLLIDNARNLLYYIYDFIDSYEM